MPNALTKLRSSAALFVFALAACTDGTGAVFPGEVERPADIDDGWSVAAPAQAGLDPTRLQDLSDRIRLGRFDHVHGFAIARGGRLVYEDYYHEHHQDSLHTLQSVTKSVGAVLIGIAIDQGLLHLDATLPELLPSRAAEIALDPAKADITLADLLSMRAGLEWDEWSCDYRDSTCNSNRQMNESADWVGFVLAQPMVDEPGTRFVYNSGVSNLLAAILRDATGQDPVDFAQEFLFGPLQIEDYRWYRNSAHADRLPHFGGGLRLKTRDLAKIGQLYLDGGVWNGERIVSREWVTNSTAPREQVSIFDHYGYQWWTRELTGVPGHTPSIDDVWFGWGFGGQHVFAVPSLDMTIVVNSWNDDGSSTAFEIIQEVFASLRDIES